MACALGNGPRRVSMLYGVKHWVREPERETLSTRRHMQWSHCQREAFANVRHTGERPSVCRAWEYWSLDDRLQFKNYYSRGYLRCHHNAFRFEARAFEHWESTSNAIWSRMLWFLFLPSGLPTQRSVVKVYAQCGFSVRIVSLDDRLLQAAHIFAKERAIIMKNR